jgi:hypothetical protein
MPGNGNYFFAFSTGNMMSALNPVGRSLPEGGKAKFADNHPVPPARYQGTGQDGTVKFR